MSPSPGSVDICPLIISRYEQKRMATFKAKVPQDFFYSFLTLLMNGKK
jgi:hypothetical protein